MKKNIKGIIVYVIIVVLILGSCYGVYYFITNKNFNEAEIKDDNAILFNEKTLPRIDASLATQPLTDAFVKNFTGKTVSEMNIVYSNTHPAYEKLVNNEVDLIVVTEPSEEELEIAKKKGIEYEVTELVNEGFVFFVNANNKVDSLTFEEVQKIYTGEITNWSQVGGINEEIVAYQRPVNSGSQTGLINLVMKGKSIKIPTIKESVELSMAGIVDYVADYTNGLNSIGYGFYYYVETMYKNDDIKYLKIDGVFPEYSTIQSKEYPIKSAYYVVTRKNEKNKNVIKLKESMLSSRGQRIAKEAGYVPNK